jgi:hypothetical protein
MSNTTQPFFTPGNAANPTSSKPTLGNAGKGIRMLGNIRKAGDNTPSSSLANGQTNVGTAPGTPAFLGGPVPNVDSNATGPYALDAQAAPTTFGGFDNANEGAETFGKRKRQS